VLTELGLVDEETTVATTVHEMQVVDDAFSLDDHDVPLDVVVTPERVIRTETPLARPEGIDWGELSEERIDEIPVLSRFR
jgi:5-formyltetrahydrofolate cyclo-ligase